VGTVLAIGMCLGSASAAQAGTISATCTWGSQSQTCDSTVWYPSSVLVTWQASSPPDSTSGCELGIAYHYNNDTVSSVSCSATWAGPTTASEQYTIHVETSTPQVSASPSRAPDSNGWYNHPVAVTFAGKAYSGIASCTPTTTFAGPDGMSSAVNGSCTDNAGKVTNASVGLNYDATPPTVTRATPSRPPDFNGWYNHPVSFIFTGTDSVSGIDSCAPVTYSGPDSGDGSVIGTCRDRAGNVATLAVPLRYDSTPPSLNASAQTGDQSVTLNWQSSSDLSSSSISRSPGLYGARESVVHRGGLGAFTDTRVRNGVHYTYTVTARDQAGNTVRLTIKATPGLRLLSPASGTRVSTPPLLRWTAARHATYYNVQVFRGRSKVLSSWPTRATLPLSRSWSFAGHRFHLKPGRYRWYVWPGFGSRTAARYGPLIGSGTFTVA
jgi:hypothetical protein